MNPKIVEGGYYLTNSNLIYKIEQAYPCYYWCKLYDKKGNYIKADYWTMNYIHANVIKRVRPRK